MGYTKINKTRQSTVAKSSLKLLIHSKSNQTHESAVDYNKSTSPFWEPIEMNTNLTLSISSQKTWKSEQTKSSTMSRGKQGHNYRVLYVAPCETNSFGSSTPKSIEIPEKPKRESLNKLNADNIQRVQPTENMNIYARICKYKPVIFCFSIVTSIMLLAVLYSLYSSK